MSVPNALAQSQPSAYKEAVQASKQIVQRPDILRLGQTMLDGTPLTVTKGRKIVAANQKQLAALRAAMRLGGGISSPREPAFEEFRWLRASARLFVLEGELLADAGHYPAAASSYLDAIELGARVPSGSPIIITGLVGVAMEAVGRQPLWKVVDKLDAPTTQATLTRLRSIDRRRISASKLLLSEQKFVLQRMDEQYIENFRSAGNTMTSDSVLEARKQLDKAEFIRLFNPIIWNADVPAGLRVVERSPKPRAINALLMLVMKASSWSWDRNRASTDLLLVSLALRAHKHATGAYPQQLNEISRDLLPAIPVDIFGYGQSLQYRREGDGYLLWSVGPDRRDDAGQPIQNPKRKDQRRWMVARESKGDIVAGINY